MTPVSIIRNGAAKAVGVKGLAVFTLLTAFWAASACAQSLEFPPPQEICVNHPAVVYPEDVDKDGRLDVVALGHWYQETGGGLDIGVAYGTGDGAFGSCDVFSQPNLPFMPNGPAAALDDYNGDGAFDVLLFDVGDARLGMLLGFISDPPVPAMRSTVITVLDCGAGGCAGGVACSNGGDLDGDGQLDIVIGAKTEGGSMLELWLGDGTGAFERASRRDFSGHDEQGFTLARRIRLVDLDANGSLEMVVQWGCDETAYSSRFVVFRVSDPRDIGQWERLRDTPPLPVHTEAKIADCTGDGHPDLIAGFYDSHVVAVFEGRGDGTFGTEPVQEYAAAIVPDLEEVADFDKDGRNDFLVGFLEYHQVLLSSENFLNQTANLYAARTPWARLVAGDFTSDGILDLVGPLPGNCIEVIPGLPGGKFGTVSAGVQAQCGLQGRGALGDLDGDGMPDVLAFTNFASDPNERHSYGPCVLLNRRDGEGAPVLTPSACYADISMAHNWPCIDDFNADGFLDVAYPIRAVSGFQGAPEQFKGTPAFAVRLGRGDGTLGEAAVTEPATTLAVSSEGGSAIVSADLNGDGHRDLVFTAECLCSGNIFVFLGNGDGSFAHVWTFEHGEWGLLASAIADIAGAESPDIVVMDQGGKRVWVLEGIGEGTFQPTVAVTPGWTGIDYAYAVDDVDGDGARDLVLSGIPAPEIPAALALFRGDAKGFGQPPVLLTERRAKVIRTADVNADGIPDVVFFGDDELNVIYGMGGGEFTPPQSIATRSADDVLVADMSGDGLPDFVFVGGGTAGPGVEIIVQGEPVVIPHTDFVRGDANADGTTNIADAVFVLSHLFARGAAPTCMDTADANDDGGLDIGDPISLLGHLFASAGPLRPPFGKCGVDPTADTLDCLQFGPCQ